MYDTNQNKKNPNVIFDIKLEACNKEMANFQSQD